MARVWWSVAHGSLAIFGSLSRLNMAEKCKGFGGKPGSGEEEAASLLGESLTADPDDVSVDQLVFSSAIKNFPHIQSIDQQ